jgi:hypothetical protein
MERVSHASCWPFPFFLTSFIVQGNESEGATPMSEGQVRGPGTHAKKTGAKLKRGAALQVMIYPRLATKSVLVEASRQAKQKLSSFIQLSALRDIARSRGCGLEDLIPKTELDVLLSQRA